MSYYHDDGCLCIECVDDIEKWGHRRVRDPDMSVTFTLAEVSNEFVAILMGLTDDEIRELRRRK